MKLELHKTLKNASSGFRLDVNLEIEEGKITTFFGKSGGGKTSMLNMISGLLSPDKGMIRVNGEIWFDSKNKINLSPRKRNVGMVFQDYALFPNMSVRKNLTYALRKEQDESVVDQLLEMIELESFEGAFPGELSGGQQQRVALARALVQKPKVLLMDEPLSALDREIRNKLRHYILKLHEEYRLTTILVSHDLWDISNLSDKLVLIENGQVTKMGRSEELIKELREDLVELQIQDTIIREGKTFHVVKLNGELIEMEASEKDKNLQKGEVIKFVRV